MEQVGKSHWGRSGECGEGGHLQVWFLLIGGGLIGYVKSKPFGNRQIISIDDLVIVVIIAVFHKKLI